MELRVRCVVKNVHLEFDTQIFSKASLNDQFWCQYQKLLAIGVGTKDTDSLEADTVKKPTIPKAEGLNSFR